MPVNPVPEPTQQPGKIPLGKRRVERPDVELRLGEQLGA